MKFLFGISLGFIDDEKLGVEMFVNFVQYFASSLYDGFNIFVQPENVLFRYACGRNGIFAIQGLSREMAEERCTT